MPQTVVVRFAAGVVGETRRQVHFTLLPGDGQPAVWTTYCGLRIPADRAEVLTRPAGMPCMVCLSAVAAEGPAEIGPSTP